LDINKKSPISRGFAGSHMLVVNGEVKPNPTWNHGSDSRPRTAVGIRKDGKFVVFATESRIQFKKIGEEMVKLDVVNAINYDSGGSTMKVRDGKIIVASEDPGAGRAVSVITYWGEVTKK
jgi:exopolysaccharide biosynthesis protein